MRNNRSLDQPQILATALAGSLFVCSNGTALWDRRWHPTPRPFRRQDGKADDPATV
jgi:hypothetical protein